MAPEPEIYCRTATGIEVLDADLKTVRTIPGESAGLEFSSDGLHFASYGPAGVTIRSTADPDEAPVVLDIPGVQAIAYSPGGRYLVTWHRPPYKDGRFGPLSGKTGPPPRRAAEEDVREWRRGGKDKDDGVGDGRGAGGDKGGAGGRAAPVPAEADASPSLSSPTGAGAGAGAPPAGDQHKNLIVWRALDGQRVLELTQKQLDRDEWPSVRFGRGDTLAMRLAPSGVAIYDTAAAEAGDPSARARLRVAGALSFAPSPAPDASLVAVHAGESKGTPGSVSLFDVAGILRDPSSDVRPPAPIARKGFYRANRVSLTWNATGTALLALATSDIDAQNKSYYGEQKLYFLSADGKLDLAVPVPKEGPIYDVQWSPRGDAFVVVAGYMPAKSTLFDDRCTPRFDLGSGPYSLVRWNPHGRFFALAGFGNLPGDVAFYDKKPDGRCRALGTTRAWNGVALEWAPDGRRVLASTLAPRLRVDNGVRTFAYDGTPLGTREFPALFQASFRADPEGTHENRPASPRKAKAATDDATTTAASASAGGAGAGSSASASSASASSAQASSSRGAARAGSVGRGPAAPAKGYVPPHLRGGDSQAAAVAARSAFSLAHDDKDVGGRIREDGVVAQAQRFFAAPRAKPLPPGAAPEPTKTASKNARRRRGKKASGAGEGDEGGDGAPSEALSTLSVKCPR